MILLGAPGAGKGTQTVYLTREYRIPAIATGEMLRAERRAGTALGKMVQAYMDSGDFVPDSLMIDMIKRRLELPDASRGFILDGFPRTLAQAQALDGMLANINRGIDAVLSLKVSRQVLLDRLSHRYTCRTCDSVYTFTPEQARHLPRCEKDGGELYQRPDDMPEVVARRIDVFLERTAPLIEYYSAQKKLETIDGEQSVDEVRGGIFRRLASLAGGSRP